MLADIDPMKGFLDRIVAAGNQLHIQIQRNLPIAIGLVDLARYKRHVVEIGMASQETADFLWPESESANG